ncbi:hypothetical protein M9434_004010 [Picochlorum sp. BPE23]|nr:hypothetical protein M9434_004010 [Picochlorum sp. BPE23]
MGLDIERFDKLKRQFPELEEGVVKEALILYDNDFDRARKALQDKYYGDDKAIEQEQSLWSTVFGESEGGAAQADDWSLDSITDGVANLGLQLIQGMDSVADAIGGLGDLIPELLFGPEEEELTKEEMEKFTTRDKKGQVVVGGSQNMRGAKKRGGGGAQEQVSGTAPLKSVDELDDEESNDWTKED